MTETPIERPSAIEPTPSREDLVQTGSSDRAIVGRSPGQLTWIRLRKDRVAVASAVVLGFFAVSALLADVIVWAYGVVTGQPGIQAGDQFPHLLDSIGYPLGYLGGITGDH